MGAVAFVGELSCLMLGTGMEEFSRQTGKLSYPIHKVQQNLTPYFKTEKSLIPQYWVISLRITVKYLIIRKAIWSQDKANGNDWKCHKEPSPTISSDIYSVWWK